MVILQNGYMSIRPTPFQPLQFQPLQFQPFTLSTVHTFNRSHFQPLAFSTACDFNHHKFDLFNSVQGYSIFSRRSKTSKVIIESTRQKMALGERR